MNNLGVLAHRDWSHCVVAEVLAALASYAGHAVTRAHQLVCGVAGHASMLAFERQRLLLRCERCGHASPGWEIGRPAQRAATPLRRPMAAPAPRLRRAA